MGFCYFFVRGEDSKTGVFDASVAHDLFGESFVFAEHHAHGSCACVWYAQEFE